MSHYVKVGKVATASTARVSRERKTCKSLHSYAVDRRMVLPRAVGIHSVAVVTHGSTDRTKVL